MQSNWIGRSEGIEMDFPVSDMALPLSIYTTRPDTLMGVTYLAVAAEHPLALKAAELNTAISQFIDDCKMMETSEAAMETMEKKGIDSGIKALHPVTGESIPVWIANFVLMGYGTGAVMAVPAHDQRDFEFAKKYDIAIKQVIFSKDTNDDDSRTDQAYTVKGVLRNSGEFDGLSSEQAFLSISEKLEKDKKGLRKVNFRLRDWGVSRQRYWGAPIPVIYCTDCGTVPVPEKDLPVTLPRDVVLDGSQSPLVAHPTFSNVACPTCGKDARRETDTFDTFMESSWYFARFASSKSESMLDASANYWLPVDHYIGGIEHAILHLLYARFYTKLLRDEGLIVCDEPFKRLLTQGMVLKDGSKMSKSKGNTVDPQGLIAQYGADTVRLFIMFAAPPEQSLEWSDSGVEGAFRFLKRLWKQAYLHSESVGDLVVMDKITLTEEQQAVRRQVHQTIQKVSHDMGERIIFNTAIAANMELVNTLSKFTDMSDNGKVIRQEALEAIVLMLAPIVPHICHQLWQDLGHQEAVVRAPWPKVDVSALEQDIIEIVIQVNGKLRSKISVSATVSSDELQTLALNDDYIMRFIEGKPLKKVIVVPKKLVNIVV